MGKLKTNETASSFQSAGYSFLRKLINEPVRSFLYEYVLKSAQAGRLKPGDSGVPNAPNIYSDPFMDTLLELLLPRIQMASGLKLFPTYTYFRLYQTGDVLKRHRDRPSCEVSVTLNLGYVAREPWQIWIETEDVPKGFSLQPGDALLYKGIDVPHWRECFQGEHSAQVFLHYVDQSGPHKEWIYDRRSGLCVTPVSTRFLEHLLGHFDS